MEFKINKSSLVKGLRAISGAISNKTFVPELAGVLMEVKNDELTLLTTSQNISMKYVLKAEDGLEIIKNGIVLIKHRFLLEVVSKIDHSEISFFKFEDNIIEIKAGTYDSKINTLDHDEYPRINFREEGDVVTLTNSVVKKINSKVVISAAEPQEGPRKILSGILLKEVGGNLVAVATDTHRLSMLNTGVHAPEGFEIVIPNKVMKEINKFETAEFDLHYSKTQIFCKLDHLLFQANIIEEKFPDISRFVQINPTTTVNLNAKNFLYAANRATALSQQNQSIKMNFNSDNIIIRSKTKEIGTSVEEINNPNLIGQALEIATNGNYLCQALRTFEDQDVIVNMTGELKPIIITPMMNKNLIQLILPVKVY